MRRMGAKVAPKLKECSGLWVWKTVVMKEGWSKHNNGKQG